MKKIKELIQQKMNASQYEKDGLRVVIDTQNDVYLTFTVLNNTFTFKDKSIPMSNRSIRDSNAAQYIHSKIIDNHKLRDKIQEIITNDLQHKLILLLR